MGLGCCLRRSGKGSKSKSPKGSKGKAKEAPKSFDKLAKLIEKNYEEVEMKISMLEDMGRQGQPSKAATTKALDYSSLAGAATDGIVHNKGLVGRLGEAYAKEAQETPARRLAKMEAENAGLRLALRLAAELSAPGRPDSGNALQRLDEAEPLGSRASSAQPPPKPASLSPSSPPGILFGQPSLSIGTASDESLRRLKTEQLADVRAEILVLRALLASSSSIAQLKERRRNLQELLDIERRLAQEWDSLIG